MLNVFELVLIVNQPLQPQSTATFSKKSFTVLLATTNKPKLSRYHDTKIPVVSGIDWRKYPIVISCLLSHKITLCRMMLSKYTPCERENTPSFQLARKNHTMNHLQILLIQYFVEILHNIFRMPTCR